jgi:hypothetical protein
MRIVLPTIKPLPANATPELRRLMFEQYKVALAMANPSLLNADGSPRGFRSWLTRIFCGHDVEHRRVQITSEGRIITCGNCGRIRQDAGNRPPARMPGLPETGLPVPAILVHGVVTDAEREHIKREFFERVRNVKPGEVLMALPNIEVMPYTSDPLLDKAAAAVDAMAQRAIESGPLTDEQGTVAGEARK